MHLIQTSHLKVWAASKQAESRFPHIVKALICAVIQPEKLRMPSGDAVWLPGYDGVLVNTEPNRFVPVGLSVWELGTDADPKGKASRDYNKRIGENSGQVNGQQVDRSEITFVFVTPLIWQRKEEWAAERRAEGIWKDVVVLDGVDLQDWLGIAPGVNLQFAAELGLVPPEGLQTGSQAWEEWTHWTTPPVSEKLVIAGREEQAKELVSRLLQPPSTFTVRGDSPREAWGFALAAMRVMLTEEERSSLEARLIVADNEEVAGRLRYNTTLIVVLKQARGQVSGFLSRRGCHVIIPEGNDGYSQQNVIVLARPSYQEFADALKSMGFSEEEAHQATRACGRSVTILQRQRAHANVEPPSWVGSSSVHTLLPALFAGRWDEEKPLDREILCRLGEVPDYERLSGELQKLLWVNEPPLQKIDSMWTLTAPVDVFQLTARLITIQHLNRFQDAFRDVFGRIDPKVEMAPDDRIYYGLKGEKSHSRWLRTGMAEALLLIAERGRDANLTCVRSPRAYAEEVVRGLPGLNDDWRLLASIRDQYPRLMEAAPNPLIESLERLLEADPQSVRKLFAEGTGLFGGEPMHTGLLWGLETLAWSPDYLPRVALILARFAALDPGGRWANRPINSLREIFLWWHPGTYASTEQRLQVLDLMLNRQPGVGWTVLTQLLPTPSPSAAHPTAKPRWRDFGDLPEDSRTRSGQRRYVRSIIDRALDYVGSSPDRWGAVLKSFPVLGPEHQTRALEMLDEIARGLRPMKDKSVLWEIIRDLTHKHRTYNDAEWALPEEMVQQLEALLPRLAPDDPIERNRWLFDSWYPHVPFAEKDANHRLQKANQLRGEAIREILEAKGVEGVVALGTTCQYPNLAAAAILPQLTELADLQRLIQQAIVVGEKGVEFAGQVSGQAFRTHGETWRDVVRTEAMRGVWPPAVVASLMKWYPDDKATWEDVSRLGIHKEYWGSKPVSAIDGSPEDQAFQIERLIEVGRAREAFVAVAHNASPIHTITLVKLFTAALVELAAAESADQVRRVGLSPYHVRKVLDELRTRTDMPREKVAQLEYLALPLLGSSEAHGLTLHEFMAKDPIFFVDVLCDVFLPANRDKTEQADPTPEERARAEVAYTLLKGMKRIPGHTEGHQIEAATLEKWIEIARDKAARADRKTVADITIGEVLAHAPLDPIDGGWPHRTVRDVIEGLASDDIDRGLAIERFNMRGVYTKAMYEGGEQERDFARKYREWAEISRARWPRMARVLEKIAEGWEEDARREDLRARQDELDCS